jgi:putative transposase
MANTYTQIYIQAVFAVQNRASLIHGDWEDELYKYITGVVRNNDHKLLAINGTSNHIHVFIGCKPHQSISSLMQDIKGSSSKWINEKGFVPGKFNWQQGYGAFSYSQSQISNVIAYIENQKTHHKKKSFAEEYEELLRRFEISYDKKYVLEEIN